MTGSIDSFQSFRRALLEAGFSIGGSNDEGVFSLWGAFTANIAAHTGDPDTDPWRWRIRAVTEGDDIAYGKFFLGKGGWITRSWLAPFISVRRGGRTAGELYRDGLMGRRERTLYQIIAAHPDAALHEIRGMMDGETASRLESALTALQARLFITISGEKFKISRQGKPYGWPVNTYRILADSFGEGVEAEARSLGSKEAARRIADRIRSLNPQARPRDMERFIG